jgi:hypothetical protein
VNGHHRSRHVRRASGHPDQRPFPPGRSAAHRSGNGRHLADHRSGRRGPARLLQRFE